MEDGQENCLGLLPLTLIASANNWKRSYSQVDSQISARRRQAIKSTKRIWEHQVAEEIFMTANSSGNCYLCGAGLVKSAMKNHILKFHKEDRDGKEDKDGQECCLLKIEGVYPKGYWLYVDIPMGKTLAALDSFLRKIWLECCGHMSSFFLPRHLEIGKSRKLGSFAVGDCFEHHYDFGTTTETVITVIGNTTRKTQKSVVRLLARNAPPALKCEECGKPAEYVGICFNDGTEHMYCDNCCDEYDENEFAFLPVTNSPRMGQCGYDGEFDCFEFDPESVTRNS